MNKKQYLTVGITILIFLIAIIVILLTKNKESWQEEILSSNEYHITMKNCTNRETEFPTETVKELFKKMNKISDNGPWTGNTEECYSTVVINWQEENIVKEIEITLIDESSIAINTGKMIKYYTNANETIAYLNELFKIY